MKIKKVFIKKHVVEDVLKMLADASMIGKGMSDNRVSVKRVWHLAQRNAIPRNDAERVVFATLFAEGLVNNGLIITIEPDE